tara:strand:+ start:4494 stop:5099 length:606 start_codon:yes stop_codon:yes gene_type:complete
MSINSNYIVRKIDRTCDVLGGIDELKREGFYKMMGYVEIVRDINEQSFDDVLSILKNLIMDGNIYADFANHLLEAGLLHDKFFEIDDNFNATKNNLSYRLNLNSYEDDDMGLSVNNVNDSIESKDLIKEEIESLEREARRAYNNNSTQIQNLSPNINSQALSKVQSTLSPEIVKWIESNVKGMSDEDYGNFMVYIAYNRNN